MYRHSDQTVTTTAHSSANGVCIRPVEEADLHSVRRIERRSFPEPWPTSAFERYVDAPGFLVAVGEEPPEETIDRVAVVGFVVADVIRRDGEPWGHVKDLAVHPARRQRGLGSRLLAAALQVLASRTDRVGLEVRASNEAAQELYRGFGFEVRRRDPGYYTDGEDALLMVRSAGRER
jgi:ribosomal-protein-alanine N-acetyltransferase